MRVGLWVLLAIAVGCGRTEEPAGPTRAKPSVLAIPAAPPPKSDNAAPTTSQPRDPNRCVVATPAEPPPAVDKAPHCPADPDGPPTLPKGRVSFPQAPGSPSVEVEIARTPGHRERGLMYRTALGRNAGMLFTWNDENLRSFWMRNTCIPLDMMFLAEDGLIVGILENVPVLNEAPRSIPCPAKHVLEVDAGWSRKNGVKAGQSVKFN